MGRRRDGEKGILITDIPVLLVLPKSQVSLGSQCRSQRCQRP